MTTSDLIESAERHLGGDMESSARLCLEQARELAAKGDEVRIETDLALYGVAFRDDDGRRIDPARVTPVYDEEA